MGHIQHFVFSVTITLDPVLIPAQTNILKLITEIYHLFQIHCKSKAPHTQMSQSLIMPSFTFLTINSPLCSESVSGPAQGAGYLNQDYTATPEQCRDTLYSAKLFFGGSQ